MGLHCYCKIASIFLRDKTFSLALYGSHGIVTDLFLTESYFVLWPPLVSCLRDWQWELCP